MNHSRRNGVLAAAVAAISLLAINRPAEAQFPAGQDGHANDANNRVGSGGYNGPANSRSAVTPNDIFYRNVTGLSGFSGPIPERDARAFTGPSAGSMVDNFVRQSSGVPTDAGAAMTYGQPQPFYGDSRYVAPPSGSLPLGFSGGYIGTMANSPSSLSNGLNVTTATGLQGRTMDRNTLLLNAMVNPAGYSGLNSPVNENTVFQNAVALYGQRTLPTPGLANQDTTQFPVLPEGVALQNEEIFRIRQEMRDAANQGLVTPVQPGAQGASQINNPNQTPGAQPASLNPPISAAVGQSLETPANSAISGNMPHAIGASQELSSTGIIPTNLRQGASLVSPEQQSTLLETLQHRLERTSDVGKAMAEARQSQQGPHAGAKETAKTGEGAIPEGPLKVSSLAAGIKSKGLRDMLASAEELMAQGKYDSAVLRFSQAQRVAPNNPLTVLGRAHAELAGGYYARAEEDLRLVFRSNPALLLAQFDLGSMLPKDRVEYIENDLRDLAERNPKAERPRFLLAYLEYNTNKPASAAADLAEAQKRAGDGDWLLRLLRQRWALPSNAHPLKLQPNLPNIDSDSTGAAPPTPARKLQTNK